MRKPPVVRRRRRFAGPLLVLIFLAYGVILFPAFSRGGGPPTYSICRNRIGNTGRALLMYNNDYDDHFPPRDLWMDAALPYLDRDEKRLHCPVLQKQEEDKDVYGYCFNAALSEARYPPEPQVVPMVFDSINLGRNASGSLESLTEHGVYCIVYADGHVGGQKRR